MPSAAPRVATEDDDARAYVRLPFRGEAFTIRMGKRESVIRVKDLSRGGISGLIEFPLAVGDYIIIVLDKGHVVEAQVRWTRRTMVGLQFSHPVKASLINRLYRRAVEAAKAETDEELL